MADGVNDFVCTICLETLQPPIRITHCGHNFCENCLKELCSSSQDVRCPNCRGILGISRNEVNNLTRNHLLEEAIEKIMNSPTALSGDALAQLYDAASFHMTKTKYNEALQLLKTVLIQETSVGKLFPLLQRARCEIEIGLTPQAETTCEEIVKLIASKDFERQTDELKQKCHDELEFLAQRFKNIGKFDTVLLIINSMYHLTKHSYSGALKLDKLKGLGYTLMKIALNFQSRNDTTRTKLCDGLLDEILSDMQMIGEVDLLVKTKKIEKFMYWYGYHCNDVKDYAKSIDVHSKLLFYVKSNFGKDARNCKVHGFCYQNFAEALKETGRFVEAKQMFKEALNCLELASDWTNDKQKENGLNQIRDFLKHVDAKLETAVLNRRGTLPQRGSE